MISINKVLLSAAITCAACSASANTDPLVNHWTFFDGIHQFYLDIRANQQQGYAISYTYLFGSGSNDVCSLSSDEQLNCMGGEQVTLDAEHHRVRLTSYGETHFYYDQAHQPAIEPLLGSWSMDRGSSHFGIEIIKSSTGDYLVSSSARQDNGYCQGDSPSAYQKIDQGDGNLILKEMLSYSNKKLKYLSKTAEIVNPSPGNIFEVGNCIYIADLGDIVFKK